jgi:hypothetical protein
MRSAIVRGPVLLSAAVLVQPGPAWAQDTARQVDDWDGDQRCWLKKDLAGWTCKSKGTAEKLASQ